VVEKQLQTLQKQAKEELEFSEAPLLPSLRKKFDDYCRHKDIDISDLDQDIYYTNLDSEMQNIAHLLKYNQLISETPDLD